MVRFDWFQGFSHACVTMVRKRILCPDWLSGQDGANEANPSYHVQKNLVNMTFLTVQFNGTVRNSCFAGTDQRTGPARRNSGKLFESICLRSLLAYRLLYLFLCWCVSG